MLPKVILFLSLMIGLSALADSFYYWTDAKGVMQVVDSPEKIPKKYRKKKTEFQKTISNEAISSTNKVSIKLTKVGDSYIVPVKLNRSTNVNLILDTGAAMTMISKDVVKKLNLTVDANTPKMKTTTASGNIEVPKIKLQYVAVQNMEASNLEAMVNDVELLNNSGVSGLLGMNYLGQFQMKLIADKNILELEKK